MSKIRVEAVKNIPLYSVVPLINHISYDSWLLRVSLFFSTEDIRQMVYVDFTNIIGFRVLDNGNLVEFWNDECPSDWLWEVNDGGWFDLEKQREGFVTGYFEKDLLTEYLVIGIDDCISILSPSAPKITTVDPLL